MSNFFNILIIDDDPDDHDMFRDSLKNVKVEGFKINQIVKINSLYGGKEALNYLAKEEEYENNKDEIPDLIVLDLNMPLIDGHVFLKEISTSKSLKQIPVYILTTSKDESDRKKCLQYYNCAGFFSKPSKAKDLSTIIRQMLNVYV